MGCYLCSANWSFWCKIHATRVIRLCFSVRESHITPACRNFDLEKKRKRIIDGVCFLKRAELICDMTIFTTLAVLAGVNSELRGLQGSWRRAEKGFLTD